VASPKVTHGRFASARSPFAKSVTGGEFSSPSAAFSISLNTSIRRFSAALRFFFFSASWISFAPPTRLESKNDDQAYQNQ
jgi:hypothetical protein